MAFELFAFSAAVAIGTVLGGPFGDRIGRKRVIWFSILGTLPFTLALPYASLFWTGPLVVMIGLILASAFPAIVVFAQELVPGKVGMVSGLLFGLAFGVGGLGAAALGTLADAWGIGGAIVCARTSRRSGCSRHCYPTSNATDTEHGALNPEGDHFVPTRLVP